MKTYFQNLYKYSALNSEGSCGYVSFIQYLSYYDTFLNDSIIPDAYERHGSFETQADALSASPGVLRQSYPEPASSGNTDFYDFVQANYTDDYQLNCMKIVNEDVFNRKNDPYSWSCSIGMWNYQGLLNGLFGDGVVEFNYVDHLEDPNDYTTGEYRERVENETKALLDQGVPVILHIRRPSGTKLWGDGVSYHSVVAYYYDDAGIHTNFGYGSSYTDTIVNPAGSSASENWYITNVGVCDFSAFSLTHSDNYEIGGLKYRGCGEHVYHTYSYEGIRILGDSSLVTTADLITPPITMSYQQLFIRPFVPADITKRKGISSTKELLKKRTEHIFALAAENPPLRPWFYYDK